MMSTEKRKQRETRPWIGHLESILLKMQQHMHWEYRKGDKRGNEKIRLHHVQENERICTNRYTLNSGPPHTEMSGGEDVNPSFLLRAFHSLMWLDCKCCSK